MQAGNRGEVGGRVDKSRYPESCRGARITDSWPGMERAFASGWSVHEQPKEEGKWVFDFCREPRPSNSRHVHVCARRGRRLPGPPQPKQVVGVAQRKGLDSHIVCPTLHPYARKDSSVCPTTASRLEDRLGQPA